MLIVGCLVLGDYNNWPQMVDVDFELRGFAVLGLGDDNVVMLTNVFHPCLQERWYFSYLNYSDSSRHCAVINKDATVSI